MVIHTYNPSSREVKVGESRVQGQVEVFQGQVEVVQVVQGQVEVMSRPACVTRCHVSYMCVCMFARTYISFMYDLYMIYMHIYLFMLI